ncbi:unnamed protein product [Notodromas monacha]|uniref:Uncharacterized protein n=1 Tax=Notodromas monacha TaxID=399045 RepID=A0A7R9BEC9_9CRUS|nr:unnamed protein product [Notodromas monacha]CAG0912205.1 unnamed protein product [Notodromas monacha]
MRKLTLILLMSCSVAVIRADLRDTFHSISKHPLGHYITYEEALQKKLLKGSPEICVGDASMPGSSSAYGCCMGTDANSPCFFSTPEMSTLLKNFLSRPLIQPLDDPLTFLSNDITPYVAQRFKRDTSNSTSVKTKRHDRAEGNRFRQGKLGGFGFRGNGEEQRRGHDDDKEDRDDGEHKEDGEHRKDGERKGHRGRHEHEEHRGNEEEDEVEEEGGVQEEEGGGDEEEGEAENEEGEAEEEEGEAEEEEDAVEDSEDEGQEDEGGEGYEESEEIVEESAENTYDYESEGSDRGGFEDELNRHGRSFKKNFRKCHSKVNHEYEHWAKQATNALQEAPDGYSPRFFELCPVKTSVVYPREAQSCDASEGTDWLRAVPVLQCPGAYMPIEIVECDWSLVEVISQFICGIRCVQQYSLVQVMSQDPESLTMRWPFVQRASGCAAFIDYDGVITESEGENDDNSNADENENKELPEENESEVESAQGEGASEDREPASGEGDTAEVSNVKVNISMESPASFPGELPEADDSTHIVLPIDYSSVNRRKEAKFFNDDQRQRGKYNYDKDFIADRGNPKIIGIAKTSIHKMQVNAVN